MKKQTLAKKLALISGAILVSVAAQNVLAHTGIRNAVVENQLSFNALNITHGCSGNEDTSGKHLDVIASSVLFPNAADPAMAVVTKLDPTTGLKIGELPDLSGDIAGVVPGKGFINLGLGLVQPNIFPNFVPVIDKNTLVGQHATPLNRGFFSHNGPIPYASAPMWESVTSTSVYGPFNVGPVAFIKSSTSCAKSLKVRVAAANWCLSGKANDTNPARMDVWIGHMTTKFNDPQVMPYSQADMDKGLFYWPTMTISRDLVANPLDPACGDGYNLAIEPADADIDANLPIPRGRAPAGAPQHYWPSRR
ncbi:MAG: hypothetical protein PHH59_03275 [Methylovulum sp.]|nr:hypothetical protein [Methylovulum sp.]MDD2723029.1 hypothetical protein [Methylovulum sp.]